MRRMLTAATCAMALAMGLGGCASPRPIPMVTMAAYQTVQPGMTVDQVNRIVGFPGRESSTWAMPGVPGVMEPTTYTSYSWSNFNGSVMTAVFGNGALQSKTQAGLR